MGGNRTGTPSGERAKPANYYAMVLNTRIRGAWERLMAPIGRGLGRAGISPNAVTIGGVLIQAGAAALILDGRLLAAGLVATVAAFADAFDGAVAKTQGRTSKFGAVLDSTTDRLSDALFFVPLAWLYGVSPDIAARDEPWVAALALVTLVAAFLVSYVKARAESLGFECDVGIAERAERLIIMILGLIFDLVPLALAVLASLSAVTLVQRLSHVSAQARAR
ncbi:MAG: CDP-alcohol phosphatidyltransferase family protein [Actinomycetota bacterium]